MRKKPSARADLARSAPGESSSCRKKNAATTTAHTPDHRPIRCLALPAIAATATASTATATATTTAVAVVAAAAATAVVATAAATVATTAATVTATTAAATATVAATTTAATEAAATATAAAAALLALFGFVHAERAAVQGAAIHALDRLGGFFGSAHGHEREAAGATGLAIGDQVDITYRSEFLERSTDAISIGIERKISNIQTSVHRLLDLAQVTIFPPRGGHSAPKRGFQNEEMLLQTPTEHRTKTCEPWQVRSYSSRFAIATRKTGWESTI
jgi:hypothetical protein